MAYFFQKSERWPKAPDSDSRRWGLTDDEYLVVCPYNKSHRGRNSKFSSHLLKCRRNYKDWRLEDGKPILYINCRYFPDHRLLPPELEFHEEMCQQTYLDGANLVDLLYKRELQAFKGPWQDWKPDMRAKEAFMALKFEPVPPALVPEGVILWADPIYRKNPNLSQIIQKVAYSSSEQHPGGRQPMVKASALTLEMAGPSKDSANVRSDDEDWSTSTESWPKFDYMENLLKVGMRNPIYSVPAGLSKSQRKKWNKFNSLRVKAAREHNLGDMDARESG